MYISFISFLSNVLDAPWSLSSKAECELVVRRTCLWLVFKVVSGGRLVPTMMVKMTISSKIGTPIFIVTDTLANNAHMHLVCRIAPR